MLPLLRPIAATLLAIAALPALAQAPAPLVLPADSSNTTALPIIRNNQLEGFLLIESGSGTAARSSLDTILGRSASPSIGAGINIPLDNGRRVGTSLSLETNPTVGLLCDGNKVSRNFGTLAQHCLIANLTPNPTLPLAYSRPGVRAQVRLEDNTASLTASLGIKRFDIQSPMGLPGASPATAPSDLMLSLNGAQVESQDIGLLGELKVGESGWVSIGGNLARARIVAANQLPGGLRPEWNTGTLSLGGGVGNFGGEIIGRVIEMPGSASYSNVGLGVTWRAPWRARLSVGAENLSSRGKNPFAPAAKEDEDSSRAPYIRYEQDL